jgi:uncharacterized repeat protein (TIGR03843 family)
MLDEPNPESILDILLQGRLEMEGLVPWGSNYTFLVHVFHKLGNVDAIYKPSKGERPLWDFARGSLALRERAAFLISEQLGWHLVPTTVLRDGPHGRGSVQYFVEHDPQQHYLTFQGQYPTQAQRIALFDVVINNADRKSGHVILENGGRLWSIDHGVCLHTDYKLRSVIWDFAGDPIPEAMRQNLVAFRSWLCYGNDTNRTELSQLLSEEEIAALEGRLVQLIENRIFPLPGPGRHYPWPIV